jgi:hypothetical protein
LKLLRARVQNYRSVRDSGWFEVETGKTILVGPNEAGKTAVLRALQTINAPTGEGELKPLRDYPRSDYTKIQKKLVDPNDVTIAETYFSVDQNTQAALALIDPAFGSVTEVLVTRDLDNSQSVGLGGVELSVLWKDVADDVAKLRAHLEKQGAPAAVLAAIDGQLAVPPRALTGDSATVLAAWATAAEPLVGPQHKGMRERIVAAAERPVRHQKARNLIASRLPVLVYYSSFFTVRPRIHLTQLAERVRTNTVDQEYDFGNLCLLKLLGFDLNRLAQQGRAATTEASGMDDSELAAIQDQLDERQYELNAAAIALTKDVRRVWGDDSFRLIFRVDGFYLKVVVEDEEGVEIELDQRSNGLVWLVSFYIVFRAQAMDQLANAILLLDEPGLSLHALKQQEFRKTVSLLAQSNQTIYTTHSPFMVGADELDLVRVVEMPDRSVGTKVHGGIVAEDPASLFPLQAALGYNLAQSLFAQRRNLVCEGLADLWYIDGVSQLLRDAGKPSVDEGIAIMPAGGASKVVYFATLLWSQELQVAALLDSDQAGDAAATQDDFVRLMPRHCIHRTKEHYAGPVSRPETEDLLRATLVDVAKDLLGWDVTAVAAAQPTRPIVEVFAAEITGFSKYKLAKAFCRWSASHTAADLTDEEVAAWESLVAAVNRSLPTS